MKKISKYEYEEGPNNSYWNGDYRAPFSGPTPIGRRILIGLIYLCFIFGVILLFFNENKLFIFSIVSMLLFIVLKHNPLRILNMLQNTLRNFKRNVNIYDKFVNECNYFLTKEKIRGKLKVKKIYISYFDSSVITLISKNDKKKIIINRSKIIIKTYNGEKKIIENEFIQYNSLKKYIEYLFEIIK